MNIEVHVKDYIGGSLYLNNSEQTRLCSNSIERVLNETLKELGNREGPLSVAEEDIEELKSIVVKVWYAAQQAVIGHNANLKS